MTSDEFEASYLGATLYMPVIHPRVPAFFAGETPFPAPSVVLCLEDALGESDVARGVAALRAMLAGRAGAHGARLYVRPRSLDMAWRLADLPGIGQVEGFVAPKIGVDAVAPWMALAGEADLRIMPTVEDTEFFDPARVVALRDALAAHDAGRIAAIRLGGNDLLGALALRREAGVTAWEGPLAWVLSMASSILTASGYPVAAPVYDVIEDLGTLRRELVRDVAAGFVSKTAIHPVQVPVIQEAFRVSADDLRQARAILDADARAVFRIGGVMCEPSTHRPWARRILARAAAFGVAGERAAPPAPHEAAG